MSLKSLWLLGQKICKMLFYITRRTQLITTTFRNLPFCRTTIRHILRSPFYWRGANSITETPIKHIPAPTQSYISGAFYQALSINYQAFLQIIRLYFKATPISLNNIYVFSF